MTEQKNYDNPTKSPVIQEIIMSNRIGAIAVSLAERLSINVVTALKMFYRSDTCARLHDKSTGLYLYGDLYVSDEFILEMQNRQWCCKKNKFIHPSFYDNQMER